MFKLKPSFAWAVIASSVLLFQDASAQTPGATGVIDLRQSPTRIKQVQETLDLEAKGMSVKDRQTSLKECLGLGERSTLHQVRVALDESGAADTHYERRIDGIPVWGERIVVSISKAGNVIQLYGQVKFGADGELKSPVPAIASGVALQTAKHMVAREFGIAQGPNFSFESTRLVAYEHRGKLRLAHEVELFAEAPGGGNPTNPVFLIDAETGVLVHRFESLRSFAPRNLSELRVASEKALVESGSADPFTESEGTGPGGNEKTGRYTYGGAFPPFAVSRSGSTYTMKNVNVQSIDLNHGSSSTIPFSYLGPENTHKVINGAYCPINDAQFFGGVVYSMYNRWYAVPPLSVRLTQRVHYGTSYENAFWSPAAKTMTYGDGASRFYPLVSLDVCSHEVSHGFTDEHSGLIYERQSGAINEAFSDMAGEAAEAYMNGNCDFEVGATIFKRPGAALRYMHNPRNDGHSIDNAADYYDGIDVHYGSGVYNKAFYNLATKWSDVRKAFHVFVYANQRLWTEGESYATAAQKVIDAAGRIGYSEQDVRDAFAAVGVTP